MYSLVLTPEIQDEIEALKHTDIDVAVTALFLLEELSDDQHMLSELCIRGNHFRYRPPFEAYPFQIAVRQGYNVFILKFREEDDGALPPYRILLAFDAQRGTYYALAIAHRSESYDPRGDAFRTLRDRYDRYGIPKYR